MSQRIRKLFVLAVIFMLLPTMAFATSQEEWDLTCRSKTTGTVTLYSISIADDGTKTAHEVGSLSSGKYIHVNDFNDDLRMFFISYLANGSRKEAYIKSESAIVQAEKTINFTDGSHIIVPEKVAETPSALQKWISNVAPGRVIAGDGSKPVSIDGTTPTTSQSSSGQTSSKKTTTKQATPSHQYTWEPQQATISLRQLGVDTSTIVHNGEELQVPTHELTFASDIPQGKKIAIIYAPNTGKCSLRQKASESAKAIKQCKAGTVVAVLEYGSKFCQVDYQGQVGYVLTRCLQFHDSNVQPLGTGMLTYNGKCTGRTTINIRHETSGKSAKIAEWKTGTQVTVFDFADGWYEIEYKGIHGYVMEKFLTMTE